MTWRSGGTLGVKREGQPTTTLLFWELHCLTVHRDTSLSHWHRNTSTAQLKMQSNHRGFNTPQPGCGDVEEILYPTRKSHCTHTDEMFGVKCMYLNTAYLVQIQFTPKGIKP